MLSLTLSTPDINLLLNRVDPNWRYEGGLLMGRVKLPIGAARMVVVPGQLGEHLILSIPFDQVKGDLTGGFLSQLTKMFWGFIKDKVTQVVDRQLAQQGLPRDTVVVERRQDTHGQVGVVMISLPRLNQWLERQGGFGNLRLALMQCRFDSAGATAVCALAGRTR